MIETGSEHPIKHIFSKTLITRVDSWFYVYVDFMSISHGLFLVSKKTRLLLRYIYVIRWPKIYETYDTFK